MNRLPVRLPRFFSYINTYLFSPLILSFLTFIFYYPSLNYPFQFDDISNIVKNFGVRFFDPSRYFFRVRWLGDLLNTINYKLGGFEPFWYRTTNVLIHIISGLFLFYFIYFLCSKTTKHLFLKQHAWSIAWLTSAIFLFHPVQTQTISYVIQARLEGIAVLSIIITLFWFCISCSTPSPSLRFIARFFMLVCSFLTCGTKEIAIVTPMLATILDYFFISEYDLKKMRSHWINHALIWFGIIGTLIYFQSIQWFTMLLGGMSVGNNRGNLLTNEALASITPYHYLISEFKVIIHYFTIFFAPFFLSVEYDWKLVPTFFCADSFIPFSILAITGCFILYSIRQQRYSPLTFGVLWFLISIAPRSTIIPSAELVCDYKTYLASIGVIFIIASFLIWVLSSFMPRIFLYVSPKHVTYMSGIVGLLIMSLYGIITWSLLQTSYLLLAFIFIGGALLCGVIIAQLSVGKAILISHNSVIVYVLATLPLCYSTFYRNQVWESAESFWRDVVEKAPTKARGHNNLGVALVNGEKYDEAIEHYRQAIALDRQYCDPWSNLSVIYSYRNEIEKGIAALKNALRIYPTHPEAHNNLGTFYRSKNDLESAEYCFTQAIKYRPHYGKAYLNLSTVYLQKGDPESAWMYAVKATQADLDTYDGFNELGKLGLSIGKNKEAAHAFEAALAKRKSSSYEIVPEDYIKIADSYLRARDFNSSLHYYSLLHKMYPHDPRYMYAMGEVFFELNNYEKALSSFSQYAGLNDSLFPHAHLRIAQCLEKLQRFNEARAYLTTIVNSNFHESIKKVAQHQLEKYNA